MRNIRALWLTTLVLGVLAVPSSAFGQVQFRTFGGGPFGVGGFGGNAFGGFNGFSYGLAGMGGVGAWGLPGAYLMPAGVAAYGGVPYMSGYGNRGWNYGMPSNAYSYYRDEPVLPGFGASDTIRTRATAYPAIAAPSRQIIAAALGLEDTSKARIEMTLPAPTAKVYLDGCSTQQTGVNRSYVTPQLNPQGRYSCMVEVVWDCPERGRRTIRRSVHFRAGQTVAVDMCE